jgi:hypothetical protein
MNVGTLPACLGTVDTYRRGHGIGGHVTTPSTTLQSVALPPRAIENRFLFTIDCFEQHCAAVSVGYPTVWGWGFG